MESILANIKKPADLSALSNEERVRLAAELREKIIRTVSVNGGHLAPNLGVVELTIALLTVFHRDGSKILWDVGHQSYAYKLLTGRADRFETIRKIDGLSGFQNPAESEYDAFVTGHAGVAVSEAMGLAVANEQLGRTEDPVVAVVGDGALGCGISLEALNNIRENKKRFIIVVNDNKMSISRSVGAISNHLNRIITGRLYYRFKAAVKLFLRKLPFGLHVIRKISRLESAMKSLFVPGIFFEELGFKYIGPINGHNMPELIDKFKKIDVLPDRPVLVHVITEKGAGCEYAKASPEKFHGIGAFNPVTGTTPPAEFQSFSSAFSDSVLKLAEKDERVVTITAAMASGTKLSEFAKAHPHRFFDVGIAEEHSLVFASGLAAGGLRPVVAVYATFLQRALDCLFHDICLQNLPVILCVDRAGVVEDGPTHHGIYDLGFLLGMPNLSVLLPRDASDLDAMLEAAYERKAPVVIRYPRGSANDLELPRPGIVWGKSAEVRLGSDVALWAAGREVVTAMETAKILESHGVSASVTDVRFLMPFDSEKFRADALSRPIVTIEDSGVENGLAVVAAGNLAEIPHKGFTAFGWERGMLLHGKVSDIRQRVGLTPEKIAEKILRKMGRPSC